MGSISIADEQKSIWEQYSCAQSSTRTSKSKYCLSSWRRPKNLNTCSRVFLAYVLYTNYLGVRSGTKPRPYTMNPQWRTRNFTFTFPTGLCYKKNEDASNSDPVNEVPRPRGCPPAPRAKRRSGPSPGSSADKDKGKAWNTLENVRSL